MEGIRPSHLPGVPLDRRWEGRGRRYWEDDVADVLAWLGRTAGASGSLTRSVLALALAEVPWQVSPACRDEAFHGPGHQ